MADTKAFSPAMNLANAVAKATTNTAAAETKTATPKSPTPAAATVPKTPSATPVKQTPATPVQQTPAAAVPTQVVYKDPNGKSAMGYIVNGKTYQDRAGTQRIAAGSVVPTTNGTYKLNADGTSSLYTEPAASAADPAAELRQLIEQSMAAAQKQNDASVDYATQKGVNDLNRALEDAQPGFQSQRDQVAIDEAQGKDNSALYSEMRGDRGGIGKAQYDSIQNTAAQNRVLISQEQQKLATETARQIADLRAQGEFKKADAALETAQQKLTQLISLEQWAKSYNMDAAQLQQQIAEWKTSVTQTMPDGTPTYQAKQDAESKLKSSGEAMLTMGLMPSAEQLKALGMTASSAQQYLTAQKLAAAAKVKSSSSGSSGSSSRSSGTSDKPKLTVAQTLSALKSGNRSPSTLEAYEYYFGEPYSDSADGSDKASDGTMYKELLGNYQKDDSYDIYGKAWAAMKKGYLSEDEYNKLMIYSGNEKHMVGGESDMPAAAGKSSGLSESQYNDTKVALKAAMRSGNKANAYRIITDAKDRLSDEQFEDLYDLYNNGI